MKNIKIKCPSCSKTGFIKISEDSVKNTLRGLLAVNIAKDIVCSHSFIAYIDRNLNVRNYFISDFNFELPEITQDEKNKIGTIPNRDVLDIDLIKLNIPATLLTYILRSIFLKQKIVVIQDQEFLHNHLLNFFKYITQNSFEADITIITQEEYRSNKKNYKEAMVFEKITIIRNVNNLINPKKLKIEKQIVNRFMTEGDLGYSYIILRNNIQRAFDYAKSINNFQKEIKKDHQLNILKISAELESMYHFKLNTTYLSFLLDIVQYYFGLKLPSITESFLS